MLRMISAVWCKWLKFAEKIGNLQFFIFLSLVYWILLPIVAIPFKMTSDPLALKRPPNILWISREPRPQTLESMKRQG